MKSLQIVDAHTVFIFTSPLLYLSYKGGDCRFQVDGKIRVFDEILHLLEKVRICLEVAGIHIALSEKVGSEDFGIFVDGPVLNDILS